MQEQLISYTTAKLAKEKGFGRKGSHISNYMYDKDGHKFPSSILLELYKKAKDVSWHDFHNCAPTQSFLQKWLREVHKIYVEIALYNFFPLAYECTVYNHLGDKYFIKNDISNSFEFSDYEQALEAGLIEALKLIKDEDSL